MDVGKVVLLLIDGFWRSLDVVGRVLLLVVGGCWSSVVVVGQWMLEEWCCS